MLTDAHISMLQRSVPKFRDASPKLRQRMIEEAADTIGKTWMDSEFDLEIVLSVYELSAELGHSDIFLAR
jgi:hypothetical protein